MAPMLSARRICPPAVVKLRHFGRSSSINRSLLSVKWREAHESKYHTSCGACLFDSFIMLATPGRKSSMAESLSSAVAAVMWARFRVGCCYVGSSDLCFFC